MLNFAIEGIGVCGPGLDGWPGTAAVLRGEGPYVFAPMRNPAPAVLAPGERRRASLAVRLAIEVACQAAAAGGAAPAELIALFASADGDPDTIHSICCAVAEPGYPVSPTRFHNSVHNAPAGYWSIAVGSRKPSSSICAYDDSFAVALLDAAVQAAVEQERVLLVASDVASPPPLDLDRPGVAPFGCALLVAPAAPGNARALRLNFVPGAAPMQWPLDLPQALRDNPAARGLAVLAALALPRPGMIRLPYGPDAHLEFGFEQ